MRQQSIHGYVDIGSTLWFLKAVDDRDFAHGEGYFLENLNILLGLLDQFDLAVTRRAMGRIEILAEKLKALKDDEKIPAALASELRKQFDGVDITLVAETKGHVAYIATDKRYSAEKLGDDIWSLFATNVKKSLPDVAVIDMEEAGKCILFERPTAAAFHLMRSVEAMLRKYHAHEGCVAAANPMWAQMISDLRKKDPKKNPELLDHLDNLRRNFRNPTQHPEKVYDIQEVQDLFGLCIDVTNRVCKALDGKDAKTP